MGDESMSMSSWHLRFDRQREYNKRKHSPVCTEAMMKGYRCMRKSHGVRQPCEDLINAMHQCRNNDGQNDAIQRKPTTTAAANKPPPAAAATATTAPPTTTAQ